MEFLVAEFAGNHTIRHGARGRGLPVAHGSATARFQQTQRRSTQPSALMGGDGRALLPPEAKRAFVAYCGRYTFDGTKLVTRVDGGSSPEMMEDQVRHIRFDGSGRMIAVPVSRLFGPGGGLELVWECCG
jgi:hypothetical protein